LKYLNSRRMRAFSSRQALFSLLLAAAAGLGSGCAKRFHLTPAELERVQTEAGVNPLRVYTSHKVLALYDQAGAEQYDVNRKIVEGSSGKTEKIVTTKNTAGLILKIEELNGKPLLWVTFDPNCKVPECAYGFVETEDRLYRLITVPPLAGYGPARTHRRCKWKKRRMAKGKLSSLAEANEVYLVKKRNGKILTVALHVKKVVDDQTTTRTRRQRGIQ
jgi:hypothetical protein